MGNISDKNTRTLLTISKDMKKELESVSKKENRSLNNLIITIIKQYLDTIREE